MKKIINFITSHSLLIVLLSIILVVPSLIGYEKTRINYDILVYLPDDIETIKGEEILTSEFGIGSYAFVMTDNLNSKSILNLEDKIKEIDGVNKVFSINDIIGTSIPKDILPDEIIDKVYDEDNTIIMVTFDESTSSDKTISAFESLRKLTNPDNISSMTGLVVDTKNLSNDEMLSYVIVSIILCILILFIATESFLVPPILLLNIGLAIIYNMGSNIFLGEISYITKAITAILQLGVTTDFSIFLYHKYEHYKSTYNDNKIAMNNAIKDTFESVIGSSLTTVAGFLALCFMDLTLGFDIGTVMAKGVIWGVICVLTVFPSLLLVFDKYINKLSHKKLLPEFKFIQNISLKHNILIIIIFIILLVPAYIGNKNYEVYYKLDESLPKDLSFNVANSKLAESYGITSPEMILIDKSVSKNDINNLVSDLKEIEGIDLVLNPSSILDFGIPIDYIPDDIIDIFNNDKYNLILINSSYEIASDKLNNQVEEINDLVDKYDKDAIVAGEGALMKDLVEIADHDFNAVNSFSIIVIFIIMILVLRSISLPVILIFTIEFAIYSNMAISYFMGVKLPFIASIIVGTIQLGATIDYAIFMSVKYLEERKDKDKKEALKNTLKHTIPSIVTSALCFFGATVGVSIYTKIDMIGSICTLLSRGAIISMFTVILVLPSLLTLFDKLIMKTTLKRKDDNDEK